MLARRYALALLAFAAEKNAVDQVAAEIAGLQQLLAESAELRRVIRDPRLGAGQVAAALKTVAQMAGFSPAMGDFLALTARNRRAVLLPQIAAAFRAERARRGGEIRAEVTSARALSQAQQELLARHLAQATGGKISLALREDPALIGGFIVQFGSVRIDASLQGKLAALAQHLREAA